MTTPEDSTAADYSGPDHGFGDDNALADEIMQQDWYADNPSPHNLSRMGLREWDLPITVEGLAPAMREPILKQLVGLTPEQRAQREPQLIRAAIEEHSKDTRILTGLGDGATPLAKAQVSIAYREQELVRRLDALNERLAAVRGANAVTDPATGQTTMVPIPAYSAEQRHIAAVEITKLAGELGVLRGSGGQRELDEALAETIEQVKEQQQQAADLAEVDRRAREAIRDEQISARAAVRAKHLRGSSNYSASL